MKENDGILYDKKISYHQYLTAAVFRLEKQRILELQTNLMRVFKEILVRIHGDLEIEKEFPRNRYLLSNMSKL